MGDEYRGPGDCKGTYHPVSSLAWLQGRGGEYSSKDLLEILPPPPESGSDWRDIFSPGDSDLGCLGLSCARGGGRVPARGSAGQPRPGQADLNWLVTFSQHLTSAQVTPARRGQVQKAAVELPALQVSQVQTLGREVGLPLKVQGWALPRTGSLPPLTLCPKVKDEEPSQVAAVVLLSAAFTLGRTGHLHDDRLHGSAAGHLPSEEVTPAPFLQFSRAEAGCTELARERSGK